MRGARTTRAEVKGMRKRVLPGAVLMQKLGTRQPASRSMSLFCHVNRWRYHRSADSANAKEYHIITNMYILAARTHRPLRLASFRGNIFWFKISMARALSLLHSLAKSQSSGPHSQQAEFQMKVEWKETHSTSIQRIRESQI
jgi:hypothetical protein